MVNFIYSWKLCRQNYVMHVSHIVSFLTIYILISALVRGAFGAKLVKNLENPEVVFEHPL